MLTMTIAVPTGDPNPCLIQFTCDYCDTTVQCDTITDNFTTNAWQFQPLTKYGTTLEYKCTLGQEFLVPLLNGKTQKSINMTCAWNEQWTPNENLYNCTCKEYDDWHLKSNDNVFKGVKCVDPPIPPPSVHLVRNYTEGTMITFGDTVSYTCQDGYYFGDDKSMVSFSLTCFDNGTWETPDIWKECWNPACKIIVVGEKRADLIKVI